MYPKNWPKCPTCGDYAMDGHITCGRVTCGEARQRDIDQADLDEHHCANPNCCGDGDPELRS